VLATESIEYGLQFTRAGWSNTPGLPRPTLQRVGYRLDGEGLWRDYWPVLDRTLAMEPTRVRLLAKVRTVRFRFMNTSREWVDRWPAADGTGLAGSERLRPAAVEITLDLEDWGVIRRVIEVAG
jgi:general secretion pathway protein J